MVARRKTFDVEAFKKRCNNMIQHAPTKEARISIAILCEGVLMDTGNYKGFDYLAWREWGCEQWENDGRPDFPEKQKYFGDETMIHFY
jgi:hypothetical protein